LVARDIDRADWRTFRLDRVKSPEPVGTYFEHKGPPLAVIEEGEDANSTIVELGSTGMYRMVGYLAGLYPPCEVLGPPELRDTLRAHAEAVAQANASSTNQPQGWCK
jgi:predicted DNA-binding transcriptional regulator YafY